MKWTGQKDDQTRVEGDYTLRVEQMDQGEHDHQVWWWGAYYKKDWINDGHAVSSGEAKRKAMRTMLNHKP